jgi:hypothetical protein
MYKLVKVSNGKRLSGFIADYRDMENWVKEYSTDNEVDWGFV